MRWRWELDLVVVKKMRNTTINKLGTYPTQLNFGNTQSLSFTIVDEGHFCLSAEEREGLKFDRFAGEKKILKKTKKMLIDEIKKQDFRLEDTSPKTNWRGLPN